MLALRAIPFELSLTKKVNVNFLQSVDTAKLNDTKTFKIDETEGKMVPVSKYFSNS